MGEAPVLRHWGLVAFSGRFCHDEAMERTAYLENNGQGWYEGRVHVDGNPMAAEWFCITNEGRRNWVLENEMGKTRCRTMKAALALATSDHELDAIVHGTFEERS